MMMTLKIWLSYIETLHTQPIVMGLDRIRCLAEDLGLLKTHCPVITVAGTNGKGSTVKAISTLAGLMGLNIGAYTSPHLFHFNERISINNQPVSDDILIQAFIVIEAARSKSNIAITYFEFTTLAALWIFGRQDLDLVILEVGLGGRLDAVNIIDPTVAIITSIGLDHTEWLGDTCEQIAREKAGIIREAIPVLVGKDLQGSVLEEVNIIAKKNQAVVLQSGRAFHYDIILNKLDLQLADGQRVYFNILKTDFVNYFTESFLLAVQALVYLQPVLDFTIAHFAAVLADLPVIILPGRMNVVRLPGKAELWLDVAHNAHAALWLKRQIATLPPVRKTHIVWCSFEDKNGDKIIENYQDNTQHEHHCWHIAELDHPRSIKRSALELIVKRYGLQAKLYSSIADAVSGALEEANSDERIVLFGSFQMVLEGRKALCTSV